MGVRRPRVRGSRPTHEACRRFLAGHGPDLSSMCDLLPGLAWKAVTPHELVAHRRTLMASLREPGRAGTRTRSPAPETMPVARYGPQLPIFAAGDRHGLVIDPRHQARRFQGCKERNGLRTPMAIRRGSKFAGHSVSCARIRQGSALPRLLAHARVRGTLFSLASSTDRPQADAIFGHAVVSNQATVWGLGCTAVKHEDVNVNESSASLTVHSETGKLTFPMSGVCFVGPG